MRCELVARALPKIVDGGELDAIRKHHLSQCLACQAELAQYKRLRRQLRRLEMRRHVVSPEDIEAVFVALDEHDQLIGRRRNAAQRAAACLGGLAAAGAVVAASRRGRMPVAS